MDMYDILKEIDFERLAGSPGEKKAREIFKKYLKKWNVNFHEHSFKMECFETGEAMITASKLKIKALPMGLAKTATVKGELVFVENSETLFCQKGLYKDKIILTNSRTGKTLERFKEEGVMAAIFISQPYRELSAMNMRQRNYQDGAIPAVYIAYNDAKELSKLQGKSISLSITQTTKSKKAVNLIADIPGKGGDQTLTCICGHYDTVATSHGANDNGAGSVILLKIAEHFAKHQPERDLRIMFFSGEEMGLLGSFAYANEHKEELKSRMGLLINVDVSGDDIGIDAATTLGTNEIMGYIDGILKEEGLLFNKKLDIYSSDCMPFSVFEIPSVNLARWGGESTFHIHTKNDIAKTCSQRGLESTFLAAKVVCERLLNSKIYPIKSGIDSSLRDKIEQYVYNSTKQEPKLEWQKKYEK
ncbi:MAG: M28 family metallopeptidase [Candidatus Cloacimonetes bacterium]|nr:M28 family metallopeptidase [Candidatus Cloacimonadota bacterium]